MKKNKLLLIILSVLVIVTVYFVFNNSDTTVRKELSDFAVKDTAAITKIFLADRNGKTITLERKNKTEWLLNGKDEPKYEFLKLFMDGVYKINVRSRVAKAAYNNVIKNLASSGIKCEIYLNGNQQPFKTYYVGGETADDLGTFMILENSSIPFITEIPGFNGYLTPRYNLDIDAWKKTTLFQKALKDIKSVSVIYTNFPEKSFIITSNNGKYSVESPMNQKKIEQVDSVAVENYLSAYHMIYYESSVHDISEAKKDSIVSITPSIVISLTDINDKTRTADIYPMPVTSASLAQTDSKGNPLKYDLDRMYGFLKPEKELVIIQHLSCDVLLRQISDFSTHNPGKKEKNK